MPAGLPALVAIAGLLAAVVALGVCFAMARRRAAAAAGRAERLAARLAGCPFGHLALDEGASPALCDLLDLPAAAAGDGERALAVLAERLASGDAERLRAAVAALRAEGAAFDLTLTDEAGARTFDVHGTARAGGGVLWLAEVSEREAARRAAEARAERLAQVVDALPLPVWQRDPALALVACNAAYARAVDRTPEAALAEGAELLGERYREAAGDLARRALADGAPVREEHHAVVEGERRLLAVHEAPLADGGLVGCALDRTEVEERQAELARHTAAHADVLESLSTAIAVYGPDMRLAFYNSAYVELWGLEESFLDDEPHIEAVLEALRERRRLPEQPDFRAYKHDRVEHFRRLIETEENLIHRPDGTTLRETVSPHPFGGVLFTFEDVTDRLSLERSFNTLIAVQRETIDNLYEGVAVFGADGRLTLYNHAYARLWRLNPARLDERPHVRELVPEVGALFDVAEADWPGFVERMVAQATEPQAGAGRMERPDGAVLDWAQVPLPDGQSLFTYLDVTDSTRVERALRERNEALETADRLKSEFIANVSYELRTPLNAIVGFAEILEQEFFGALNDRQRDYAQAIVQSSQRLMHLINDILDLATIEAGYMTLDRGEVDVRALLEGVQSLVHERARSCGIELGLDCPADAGAVEADERRLKQALFNLLSNAFNFTPAGGQITLAARRAGEELQLAVSDTGVGIPHEQQARVFDKFERGREPGRGAGAGLGLALVKHLIELHGGRVELVSTPEEGTRVTCHLPLSASPAAAAAGPEGAAARPGDRV